MNANDLADLIDSGVFPRDTLELAAKTLRKQAKEIENLNEQFDKAVEFLTKLNLGIRQ
jgi:hypothetical protein